MTAVAGGIEIALPGEEAAAAPVLAPVRVMRNKKNPQLAAAEKEMAAIDKAKYIPSNWGTRFELSVQASILRGEVKEMAGVTHAFRMQHNESGHGIDILAVGTGKDGKLKIWHVECKWTTGTSKFPQQLKGSAAGMQTSAAWTKANFAEWWKVAPAAERRQLMHAVTVANGGRAVSEARLTKLITQADVIIAGPVGMGALGVMRLVWGRMSALSRAGRNMLYLEFRPR